ncbi:hypothetical protein HD554DRAFT_271188 [Boletus coccyginus]|nr:hypothetical protein HD554DRAFT_271188 [Boletus coccyginus]
MAHIRVTESLAFCQLGGMNVRSGYQRADLLVVPSLSLCQDESEAGLKSRATYQHHYKAMRQSSLSTVPPISIIISNLATMQLRFSLTFFLSALVVLLTWTSLAQGVAINRDISPVRRDLGGARASGVEVFDDFLRRDGVIFATKPEGAILVGRASNGADTLAARAAGEQVA